MTAAEPLPIAETAAELTPEWLTAALGGDATVRHVSAQPIGTGQMGDSVRLELTYDPDAPADLPRTLVAKLPAADPTSRATARALRSYENEVRFYQELAGSLPVRTPSVYYADIDVGRASFVLLLEDLAPAVPGDQLAGCTPEEARRALQELVQLHAPRWGDPGLARLEWLHKDPEAGKGFYSVLLPGLWDNFRERYAAELTAEIEQAGDCLFSHMEAYLAGGGEPWTVVHGDYRLDNLLFDDSGGVRGVLDWQTCGHGPGLQDVAYFVGAGLSPEDRRASEEDLLRDYFAGIVAAGVTGYDWERCQLDYRRGIWLGIIMAVAASMLVERTARGDQMFLTMASRHARHALDLDAGELLGA